MKKTLVVLGALTALAGILAKSKKRYQQTTFPH